MNITEAIAALEAIRAEWGDLNVCATAWDRMYEAEPLLFSTGEHDCVTEYDPIYGPPEAVLFAPREDTDGTWIQ